MLTQELHRRMHEDLRRYYQTLREEAAATPVADLPVLLEERELAEMTSYVRGMLDEVRTGFRKQVEQETGDPLLARELGRRLEQECSVPTLSPMSHERVVQRQPNPVRTPVSAPEPVGCTETTGSSGKLAAVGAAVAAGAVALVLRRPWIALLSLIGAVAIYAAYPAGQQGRPVAQPVRPVRSAGSAPPERAAVMAEVDKLLVQREAEVVALFERVLNQVHERCAQLDAERSASHA